LINLNQKIKTVSKDRLYYDQYRYCVQVYMQEICGLRYRSHQQLHQYLEHQRFARKVNYGGSWTWPVRNIQPISDATVDNCHRVLDAIKDIAIDHKTVYNCDTGYFYTNNIDPFVKLINETALQCIEIRQAKIDRPRDTIVIKSSTHQLRTYFRCQRVTADQKHSLCNLFANQQSIRLSPGLTDWVKRFPNHQYISDNYFVDHNDDGFLTLLALSSSVKIKKTLAILTE